MTRAELEDAFCELGDLYRDAISPRVARATAMGMVEMVKLGVHTPEPKE